VGRRPDGTANLPAQGRGPVADAVCHLLQPIAYRFRKGNGIRLEIATGDSPVTRGLFFHFYRPDKMSADTIFHDAEHPSERVPPILNLERCSRRAAAHPHTKPLKPVSARYSVNLYPGEKSHSRARDVVTEVAGAIT